MKQKLLIIFLSLILLSSCEKEININLNKNNPKYVVEGNLSTLENESYIKITQTLNFDETIDNPRVSGALVTITDNTLIKTDTLIELKPGIYRKIGLAGTEGHNYTLKVQIGKETFTSLSTIPYSIKLDSLMQLNLANTSHSGSPGSSESGSPIQILPIYKNTTRTDKYFQIVIIRNDTLQNTITTRSDLGSTGNSIPFPIFLRARKNDTLKFDIQFIDKTVYDYLFGLSQNINQFSSTPSNPTSNISNGALGFFKAHTSQKKIMVIK